MKRLANHIAVALLLLLSACSSGEDASGLVMDERMPVPQEATERVFPVGEWTVVDTLRVEDPLFLPASLDILDSGEMIVSDRGSHEAIRLSSNGTILIRYGTGIGNGPGEHRSIENAGQLSEGTVWTWDGRNRRINLFEAEGSFIASTSPGTHIQVATALTPEKFVGVSPLNPDPFVAFDWNGRITGRWGRFVDEPGPDALPFLGYPQRMQSGEAFVYVSMFAGRLYAYDFDGSLVWHRSVIDRFEIPSVSEDGMEYDEDDPPPQQFALNVSEDHVHTRVNAAYHGKFYVDTYDVQTGDYRYSLQIPPDLECAPLYVDGSDLHMRCDAMRCDAMRYANRPFPNP